MSRTREDMWGEILRTAWLVRSQSASIEPIEEATVSGRDTVPFADAEALALALSDAITLVRLIEEHERTYPTEAGAQLPPQPPAAWSTM